MIEKVKSILSSIRFWIVTFTAVVAILIGIEKSGFVLADFLNVAQIWLLGVAGIGTLDSIAEKLGYKK